MPGSGHSQHTGGRRGAGSTMQMSSSASSSSHRLAFDGPARAGPGPGAVPAGPRIGMAYPVAPAALSGVQASADVGAARKRVGLAREVKDQPVLGPARRAGAHWGVGGGV